MQSFAAAATAELLDLSRLMAALEQVLDEYGRGEIESPQRLGMRFGGEAGGVLLSMPCHAHDLVIHKLLTICALNPAAGLPTIQGQVTAFDAGTGKPLVSLDGPTVTARRTAAVSMVAIARLRGQAPARVALIGTGTQAQAHAEALLGLYPAAAIRVRGTSADKEMAFVERFASAGGRVAAHEPGPVRGDVVIAATASLTPVFDEAAEPGRLVIGVGAYRLDMVEIGRRTIAGSQIYVDDPIGAPSEAGDLVAAGADWSAVRPLAQALREAPDPNHPVFFKSVGCAAWDLAACRAARTALGL